MFNKILLVLLFVLGASSLAAYANKDSASGLKADALYSFATSATQKNGFVGGMIQNTTDVALVITRAESPIAERVELHTHEMDGDVTKMRRVDSYTVAPHAKFALGPKGDHIMLFGLKEPLSAGDSFTVRLFDADGESVELPVFVRAAGDIPAQKDPHAHHKGHDSHHDAEKGHEMNHGAHKH